MREPPSTSRARRIASSALSPLSTPRFARCVPGGARRGVRSRCRSWPGARLASGALPLADGRADNPGESWSRVVLIALGFAPDDLQVRLEDDEGLIGYADFGWDDVSVSSTARSSTASTRRPTREGRCESCSQRSARGPDPRLGYGVARWGWAELAPAGSRSAQRVREARESSEPAASQGRLTGVRVHGIDSTRCRRLATTCTRAVASARVLYVVDGPGSGGAGGGRGRGAGW